MLMSLALTGRARGGGGAASNAEANTGSARDCSFLFITDFYMALFCMFCFFAHVSLSYTLISLFLLLYILIYLTTTVRRIRSVGIRMTRRIDPRIPEAPKS